MSVDSKSSSSLPFVNVFKSFVSILNFGSFDFIFPKSFCDIISTTLSVDSISSFQPLSSNLLFFNKISKVSILEYAKEDKLLATYSILSFSRSTCQTILSFGFFSKVLNSNHLTPFVRIPKSIPDLKQ